MGAEAPGIAGPNASKEYGGVGMPGEKVIGSGFFIRVRLEVARKHVDQYEVLGRRAAKLRPNDITEELFAAARDFGTAQLSTRAARGLHCRLLPLDITLNNHRLERLRVALDREDNRALFRAVRGAGHGGDDLPAVGQTVAKREGAVR